MFNLRISRIASTSLMEGLGGRAIGSSEDRAGECSSSVERRGEKKNPRATGAAKKRKGQKKNEESSSVLEPPRAGQRERRSLPAPPGVLFISDASGLCFPMDVREHKQLIRDLPILAKFFLAEDDLSTKWSRLLRSF